MLIPAVAFSQVILALHILAVVVAFGVTFAYPVSFATRSRLDPARCRGFTAPSS